MPDLGDLRNLLQKHKKPAAGQKMRYFLPNGSLEQILTLNTVQNALSDPSFQIPPHKKDSTAQTVIREARKVFAVLVELKLEHALAQFIENEIMDKELPVDEKILERVICSGDARDFIYRQWEYLAYNFRRGPYQREIRTEIILPYLEEEKIGGGGYSTVYEVFIHSAHQDFKTKFPENGVMMVRKKLTAFNSTSTPKDEAELLFLLSSHKHDNIVELLTSYSQDGVVNLIFERADMDLHHFLLQEKRVYGFEDDRATLKALHGLSSGLKYIHCFEPMESHQNDGSVAQMLGCHQDIKPRNILVRGTDFILADFGLMRLRASGEDSKTLWKDGTYEYGAPECRDPLTLQQGRVGRASDIWSLGCVVSELVVYLKRGHNGVSKFRDLRVTDNTYGKTRCFHNNLGPNPYVMGYLSEIGDEAGDETKPKPMSELYLLIQDMFATSPADRLDANIVESRLSRIATQALLKDLLEAIDAYLSKPNGDSVTNVFRVRLRLEEKRLRAWAGLLGLCPIHEQKRIVGSQSFTSFSQIWRDLELAIWDLKVNCPFETTQANEDFIVLKMHQTNDSIYNQLSEIDKASADGIFAALSTADTETKALLSISQLSQQRHFQYQNIGTIAAMKYMSILLAKQPEGPQYGSKLDQSLIERDYEHINDEARPETFWYNFGYQESERDKILIEWKGYGAKWKIDPKSREFKERGEAMFDRIQGLVAMLCQPKPAGFQVLDCLGCFHDAQQQKFGIVYKFPSNQSTPIRLHHFLRKRDRSAKLSPHIGEKVALARALAISLHAFHISGWIHKDINSRNILFFTPSSENKDVELAKPYVVGFNHSREDDERAYTEGTDFLSEWRKYQHPNYQTSSMPFKREYDYYSFGLVLIEIGAWERLSNVYSKYETETPSQLRQSVIYLDWSYLGAPYGSPKLLELDRLILLVDWTGSVLMEAPGALVPFLI